MEGIRTAPRDIEFRMSGDMNEFISKRHFHNLGTHIVCSSSNNWGICCIINVNFVTSFLRKHVSTSKVCLFGYL